MAFAAHPENPHFKVAVARAMPHEQKAEAIALLREAAAQGDAEAYYEIYEHHKSWDRGDLDKMQLVTRAEADRALHKAAELGHPFSTQMLAVLLDRGDTVKRDPAAARYWAERAVANPAKDASKGDLLVLLGRLLVTSDKPDERARGLEILERLAAPEQFGAKTRTGDRHPQGRSGARAKIARGIAVGPIPAARPPPLAEMLIAGEGGPADPKRALSLLKDRSDKAGANGVLGRLYLEGRLVPRDVQEAVRLIGQAGAMGPRCAPAGGADARGQSRGAGRMIPSTCSIMPTEAAELDEPGAMAALIEPETVAKRPVSGPARSL